MKDHQQGGFMPPDFHETHRNKGVLACFLFIQISEGIRKPSPLWLFCLLDIRRNWGFGTIVSWSLPMRGCIDCLTREVIDFVFDKTTNFHSCQEFETSDDLLYLIWCPSEGKLFSERPSFPQFIEFMKFFISIDLLALTYSSLRPPPWPVVLANSWITLTKI